jgi:hypothetical protein
MAITSRTVSKVLTDLLVSIDKELLIERWVKVGRLGQLRDSLCLLVHPLHEEKGVLYLK